MSLSDSSLLTTPPPGVFVLLRSPSAGWRQASFVDADIRHPPRWPDLHEYTNWYLVNQGVSQILCHNQWMAERWTRERRLEHTRALLLDAAEEVFAEKGFTTATLDDIAYAAGYTKGAIYKHFATKEDLFLAVSDRYWRRYFDTFAEVMSTAEPDRRTGTRRHRRAVASTEP